MAAAPLLPRLAALAAVLLPSLAAAQAAPSADVPLPPPPAGMRPVPTAKPSGTPGRPAPRTARFHLGMGFDFGSEEYATLVYDDGSKDTLDLNDGFVLSAGVSFLPLAGGRLDTLATAGFKYWSVGASNGSLAYRAFPIEVLERVRVHPAIRLGAGLSLQLAPEVKADGIASDLGADAKSSLGVVLQGEGVFRTGPAEWSAGLRYVWQKLQNEAGGPTVDASAIGFFFSWQP